MIFSINKISYVTVSSMMILRVIIALLVKNAIALEDEVVFINETVYETYEGDLVFDNETIYENYGEDLLIENETYTFPDQANVDPSDHVFAVYHENTGSWQVKKSFLIYKIKSTKLKSSINL